MIDQIAKRLQRLRAAAGLSTRQLAEKAGVSQWTVTSLENAHAENVSIVTLCKLADALGIAREVLAFGRIGVPMLEEDLPVPPLPADEKDKR